MQDRRRDYWTVKYRANRFPPVKYRLFWGGTQLRLGDPASPTYNEGMTDGENKIVETLAHAKDAAAVLNHIDLNVDSPAVAGVQAEILAADASLQTAIDTLKTLQKDSTTDRKEKQ